MSIPDILLAVCVLILVWRVWRLEYRLEAFDRALMRKGDVDWLQGALNENLSRCVAGSEQRVSALARALGYEWKRTDAKEGWEPVKLKPFGFGCAVSTPLRPSSWVWCDEPPADRRKADRRKPTASSLAADDMLRESETAKAVKRAWTKADLNSVFGPGGKKAPKKKRRATH